MWWLFLDDERFPVDDNNPWIIARSVEDAIWLIKKNGIPAMMSLDHDLGPDKPTGMDFCKWIVERELDLRTTVVPREYQIHSQNPVGAENMKSYLDAFIRVADM